MWYVLYAEPGGEIIYGLRPGVTREAFAEAVANKALAGILRRVPVQAGDAICVPSGTVHALLSGLVVAEIQQNSDTTYRVYDWDRPGPDGRPRPLHIERALDVIDFGPAPAAPIPPTPVSERNGLRVDELVACDKFVVERVRLAAGTAFAGECDGSTFELWGAVEGRARLEPGERRPAWPSGAQELCRQWRSCRRPWALLQCGRTGLHAPADVSGDSDQPAPQRTPGAKEDGHMGLALLC